MMHILYEPFPDTVTADGQEFEILTDFREWLRFAEMISDTALDESVRVSMMGLWLTPEPERITQAIRDAVFAFFRADALRLEKQQPENEDRDETESDTVRPPVFDWKIDAKFLLGDFRRYYGIDLLNTAYLHWWEFRALTEALPDDSQCMKRIAYRSANLSEIKDKHERKRIAKIQRQIALPFTYTDEMIGAALWSMK